MSVLKEEIEDYLSKLYKPPSKDLYLLRCESEKQGIPIILKDTESFLLNIIRSRHITEILEIGTAVGYSSSCFACISEKIRITTVEKSEDMYSCAKDNITKLKLQNRIDVVNDDALLWLQKQNESARYDMVFIDGPKSHYLKLWKLSKPLVRSGGLIITDNVLFRGYVACSSNEDSKRYKTIIRKLREFISFLNENANSVILPIGDGISISYIE